MVKINYKTHFGKGKIWSKNYPPHKKNNFKECLLNQKLPLCQASMEIAHFIKGSKGPGNIFKRNYSLTATRISECYC